MSRGTRFCIRSAHPSTPRRISPGGARRQTKNEESDGAQAKEKIVEYRNSCAIRGLPSALYRVLPFLNIEFRSRYPRLDESRTSGPGILRIACSQEHQLPTPSRNVNGVLNLISDVGDRGTDCIWVYNATSHRARAFHRYSVDISSYMCIQRYQVEIPDCIYYENR